MRKRWLSVIFLFSLKFCLIACSQENRMQEEVFDRKTSSRISNLNIRAFCQDSLGYMWIATPRGLNKYNGYEYIHFFHDADDSLSIRSDHVLSLYLDSEHRLWIGTSAGVCYYDFQADKFIKYGSANIYAYSFFEDHNHTLWVASHLGLGRIDLQSKEITFDMSLATNLVWEDKNNMLWAGLSEKEGLAVRKSDSTWELISLPGNRQVTCIYTDRQGLWWLGTNEGIVIYDPVQRLFRDASFFSRDNHLLNHTQIHFIKEISPLRLLIGTASQGAFLYDIPTQTLYHRNIQYPVTMGMNQ